MSDWQKFFAIRLPLALLGTAAVLQVLAMLLSGVTPHRHNVDDLANAVLHDRHPYSVVLVGDSVTHNVAHKFRIGAVDQVADLTTHANAGLPSSLFLLKRYLESGHRPQQVLIAASRGVFVLPMDRGTFAYYVTSVFQEPYEHDFLQRYYADFVDYRWKPAALNITTKIGEPLFSLLRRPSDQIWTAPDAAPATPTLERYPLEALDPVMLSMRMKDPSTVRPEVVAILNEFCALSRQYGFSLHLIWAPMPPQIRDALQTNGVLTRMDAQMTAIFAQNHTMVSIDDASAAQSYPYFDRELVHIKGEGWEQTYALELGSFVRQFNQAAAASTPSASR